MSARFPGKRILFALEVGLLTLLAGPLAAWADELPSSRLDHKLHPLGGNAPGGIIREPLVGQGALCPTRVGETEPAVLIR